MNIIQATKLLLDGKKLRLPWWEVNGHIRYKDTDTWHFVDEFDEPYYPTPTAILEDRWEEYSPVPKEKETKMVHVTSSHGEFYCDDEGFVLESDIHPLSKEAMGKIFRFDLSECRKYWKDYTMSEFDILDLGYWSHKDGKQAYTEPDHTFRKHIKLDKE
jgi:hypothetical protein